MYNTLINFLFKFIKDPETVHRLSLVFLGILGLPIIRDLSRLSFQLQPCSELQQKVFGITFKNPIGLAAGFDKNAEAITGLEVLGFGHLELGSVTSQAQSGNSRQRIFRFEKDRAIINRMGFNNHGRVAMKDRLRKSPHTIPLGISLGKLKTVELKDAPEEYATSYETLYGCGDYFVINVSSPNTPGLRELQDKEALVAIVAKLNEFRKSSKKSKPLLVKIAPDLTNDAIDEVLAVCREQKLDGIIATNTTIGREGLSESTSETGGMSGAPLQQRSTEIIRYIYQKAPELPIIGVGGVFTAGDAYEKIKAGASLVQVYTGFVYKGPFIVRDINKGLLEYLKKDGYNNIAQAVGSEKSATQ